MEQFKHSVEVKIGERTFESSKLHIEFDVPFDDDADPNESVIRIYNLSENSINQLQRNQVVTINAGYEGDVGVLMQGRVSYVSTRKQGPDIVTSVYAIDGPDLSGVKIERKAFAKGTKASTILKSLVPLLKLPVASFILPKDKSYPKGYSLSGKIADNLASVAHDCGASFYVNRGKLYIRPLAVGDDAQFILKTDTGLIGSPEYFQDDDGMKGYSIESLLQYRITTGSIIDIESRFAKGRFRVRRGRHTCSGDEFITQAEVVENVVRK